MSHPTTTEATTTSSPTPPEPSAFPYFSSPLFPAEIQDLIWTFAITAIPGRTVDITTNPKSPSDQYSWISTAPIPALLWTCSRSRFLTQQAYPFSFVSNSKSGSISKSGRSTLSNNDDDHDDNNNNNLGTYFNFQKTRSTSHATSGSHLNL